MSKRKEFDAEPRSVQIMIDPHTDQVVAVLDYVRIPEGTTNVRLTLAASRAEMQMLADRLSEAAKQVSSSKLKH